MYYVAAARTAGFPTTQSQQFIFQYSPMSAAGVWSFRKTNNNQLSRSKAFANRHYCLDSSLGVLFIYPVALIGPNPSRLTESLSACPLIIPRVSWKWNFYELTPLVGLTNLNRHGSTKSNEKCINYNVKVITMWVYKLNGLR